MKEPVVSFDEVSKSYPLGRHVRGLKSLLLNLPRASRQKNTTEQSIEALHNISFDVYRGESFGIIGRNGAGKSTTLGLIAGVLKPTHGRVIVRGRISPLLALGAGFHPELTGRENILLNGVLMGLTKREVMNKLDEIIEFSELGNFIDRPIRIYSSGMLARLGFSVVAHLDPEILLIDEILGVGDMKFQRKCFDKMMSFRQRGVTMILVTHSLPSVKRICDRAMWIENHTIKMIGSPSEIAESYCSELGIRMVYDQSDDGGSNLLDLNDVDIETGASMI
jgi:lipopolysaccharide transport system ATP-binding protein